MKHIKNSAALSLPKERKVRGYTVRRMPLGAYLSAMESLQEAPARLMKELFPGKDLPGVLNILKNCDGDSLSEMIMRLMAVAPGMLIDLVSGLTGIDSGDLLEDPAMGADGFMELVAAWLEVNGIENFIKTTGEVMGKVKALVVKNGTAGCSG